MNPDHIVNVVFIVAVFSWLIASEYFDYLVKKKAIKKAEENEEV